MSKNYPRQVPRQIPLPIAKTPAHTVSPTARVLVRFQRFAWDIGGVVLLAFALMTFLALLDLSGGALLRWWRGVLFYWLGWGSYMVPLAGIVIGFLLLRRRSLDLRKIRLRRVLALEVAAFTALALLSVLGGHSVARVEFGLDGGLVGWGLVAVLRLAIQPLWLLGGLLSVVYLLSALIGLGLIAPLGSLARRIGESLKAASMEDWEGEASRAQPAGPAVSIGNGEKAEPGLENGKRRIPQLPSEYRKKFKVHLEEEGSGKPPVRDERLPPLDILMAEQTQRPDERNINLTAGMIEKTLAEFGIPAKVVGFRVGPTVTQFAVEPGFVEKPGTTEEEGIRQKVRVAQIASLSRDLALALSAERLRIEAPVPGRPYVGIEVPNARSTIVRLRPILETEAFYRFGSPLTIALGRDVSGQAVVADLARMPHLLVAGTTGSGKSVSIAALTTCLVMNNTPEDLRLVMIDPKMVELVRFNGLPHLFGKVETSLERILGVLRWTVAEMDRRYMVLEASRSRNLDSYNRRERRRKGGSPLPHIVVMLDELADLMMSAPDETEHTLVRLAQMARATGIHLVVATQRPSTDVVTGLIKANFPARIAFTVASSIDSRVILDVVGAESLLGRGDMLFLPPEASNPIRAQGIMVTDQEIERVITFWQKNQPPPEEEASSPWETMLEQEASLANKDDLIARAISVVRESQRASASMLQRRLHIGYPRAARLIDELEELGIVGPAQGGGKEREVLIREDEQYGGED